MNGVTAAVVAAQTIVVGLAQKCGRRLHHHVVVGVLDGTHRRAAGHWEIGGRRGPVVIVAATGDQIAGDLVEGLLVVNGALNVIVEDIPALDVAIEIHAVERGGVL